MAESSKKRPKRPSDYPVPGAIGGQLIRTMLKAVRSTKLEIPVTSHILCACSGGADSTALALLVARYGRRLGSRVSLLHINHGWRGEESDGDEAFVLLLGKKLGIPVWVERLEEKPKKGESWEAHARDFRKVVFRRYSARLEGASIFTGHTADDQAETRLWRLFTGAPAKLGGGILMRHGVEVRPLLGVRRRDLISFLHEEKQIWREDSSNFDPRFLRARMRRDLMPVLEEIFPKAIESINSVDHSKS
ncbi:MAG: tRNA lysidine(34) synthetase TilS [Cryobacterium sp.]|nr:tRNA lysidine(34) synthetase TilS [Oligoflexia bacterium]